MRSLILVALLSGCAAQIKTTPTPTFCVVLRQEPEPEEVRPPTARELLDRVRAAGFIGATGPNDLGRELRELETAPKLDIYDLNGLVYRVGGAMFRGTSGPIPPDVLVELIRLAIPGFSWDDPCRPLEVHRGQLIVLQWSTAHAPLKELLAILRRLEGFYSIPQ